MLRRIRQFGALPHDDKRLLTKISIFVPFVEMGIKTVGFKRTFKLLKFFVIDPPTSEVSASPIIERHMYLLYLFTKHAPFSGNCLANSLTLWVLLRNKGIETDLRFGMKKDKQKLLAHAWLEYKGEPLASDMEVEEHYSFFAESILTELVE